MGLGTSTFLLAAGAILNNATNTHGNGANIHTVGLILMLVGALRVVVSLILWNTWAGYHREHLARDVRGGRYIEEDAR